MWIQELTIKPSVAKNVQAIMPQEEDKRVFETALVSFLENLHTKQYETEEFQKNLLRDFLQICLPNNFINTNERTDLVIYNGPSPESTAGVLFEVKSLSNKNEMMSKTNINTKAFQEIIHYYLNERLVHSNIELKKCIITNGLEWFIIESKEIEKHYVKNKKLIDLYKKWMSSQLSSTSTEFLYKEVIAPAIEQSIENGLQLAHFNLSDALKKGSKIEIKKNNLTHLYRFFTPENLLNKVFFADPNKLNKGFYDELLYLMGLDEVKVGNKRIIQRLPKNKRQIGSFVENIIDRLQMSDVPDEQQYEVAIQLTVIWINRILFLKLLESQLIAFNGQENYKFLTKKLLPTFDDVYYLFFGVLARKVHQRTSEMSEKFPQVPYLNSSLFEETELETSHYDGIGIDRLREHQIEYYSKTILKGTNKKRKTGKVDFLTYLFDFLNAYDFSTSIGNNKKNTNNLINAAVLGLIFEKINGYNEGSFYTPGRITMYMSKTVIRRAVVNKINAVKDWNCKNIYEVQFKINSLDEAKQINEIIDTLKICDPAVGSGHFLVSVLNELIAIKSELRVLMDSEGRSMNDIQCTVVADELVVQDFNGDNFSYQKGNLDSERIQKAIFLEKRKLIENCLFAVDINPNSANICRLRLWIELLKHSYYYWDEESNTQQLITLPNIDINIKVGNSLLHKFGIDDILDKRFSDLRRYSQLVSEYKGTNDKLKKQELTKNIDEIKQRYSTSIQTPEVKQVSELTSKLTKVGQTDLFASREDIKRQTKEMKVLEKKLKLATIALDKSRKNPLFRKGLEWRIEFPEVLDAKGNFVGFDVIIGNPPYVLSRNLKQAKQEDAFYRKAYSVAEYQINTYHLFIELGYNLLREHGTFAYIIPNKFLSIESNNHVRKFIQEKTGNVVLINSFDKIFEDASVDNCILFFDKTKPNKYILKELRKKEIEKVTTCPSNFFTKGEEFNFQKAKYPLLYSLVQRLNLGQKVIDVAKVRDGVKAYEVGKGTPPQPKGIRADNPFYSDKQKDISWVKFVDGKDVIRYSLRWGGKYINYGKHLAAPRDPVLFEGERILIRQVANLNSDYVQNATLVSEKIVNEQSSKIIFDAQVDIKFLLGVINSRVISIWSKIGLDFLQIQGFPRYTVKRVEIIPVPKASEKEQVYLSNLVEKRLNLHEPTQLGEENIKRLTKLDTEIDELVMTLFGLNEEEKQAVRYLVVK